MKQNRFKSPVLWGAVLSQVVSILLLTGTITISESEVITNIMASVFQLLVLLGVLNDPTTKDKP